MGPQPRPSRRTVLAGAAGAAAGLLTGCTPEPEPPPPPDPFGPLIDSAIAHAELADAVAIAHPPLAAAARLVASDRRVHADVLRTEVRRATPSPSPTSTTGATTTGGPQPPADPAAARTVLLEASVAAQRQAAELVGSAPRYRAGLVASIAACCASHAVVLR